MREILASQRKMLHRHGKEDGGVPDDQMKAMFESELNRCRQWLGQQPNFSVLYINYIDMIQNPLLQARRINDFLTGSLDISAIADSVDPNLYRNRGHSQQ